MEQQQKKRMKTGSPTSDSSSESAPFSAASGSGSGSAAAAPASSSAVGELASFPATLLAMPGSTAHHKAPPSKSSATVAGSSAAVVRSFVMHTLEYLESASSTPVSAAPSLLAGDQPSTDRSPLPTAYPVFRSPLPSLPTGCGLSAPFAAPPTCLTSRSPQMNSLRSPKVNATFSHAIQQYFTNMKASLEIGALCFEALHWSVRFAERVLESARLVDTSTVESLLKFLVSALLHALAGAEKCDAVLSWRCLGIPCLIPAPAPSFAPLTSSRCRTFRRE